MIDVNRDGGPPMADLDPVRPTLAAGFTRPESDFSAPC